MRERIRMNSIIITCKEESARVIARYDGRIVFTGKATQRSGMPAASISCSAVVRQPMRARNINSAIDRLIRFARLAFESEQQKTAEVCERCGSEKPADRSCDCFDNHCQ